MDLRELLRAYPPRMRIEAAIDLLNEMGIETPDDLRGADLKQLFDVETVDAWIEQAQ